MAAALHVVDSGGADPLLLTAATAETLLSPVTEPVPSPETPVAFVCTHCAPPARGGNLTLAAVCSWQPWAVNGNTRGSTI